MAEGMTSGSLVDAGFANGLLDSLLYVAFMDVMTTYVTRAWFGGQLFGWKDRLPTPLSIGIRVFFLQCIGQLDFPVALGEVGLMDLFCFYKLLCQR
jgi:hypothetical protein